MDGEAAVGVGLGTESMSVRLKGVLALRQVSMNEAGDEEIDSITAEYGGLLVRPEHTVEAYRALFSAMARQCNAWHEIRFSATLHSREVAEALPANWTVRETHRCPAYVVELSRARATSVGYEGALAPRMRTRLAKIVRRYEEFGPLRVEPATSATTRATFLRGLRDLHQEYWTSKGKHGAFSRPFFGEFLEQMIDRSRDPALVQLTRVMCGLHTVGFHLHLQNATTTYYYQSGYQYNLFSPNDRPGFLCHLLMIRMSLESGLDTYDFLAGDQRYKRDLATAARSVAWLHVCRPNIRSTLYGVAYRLRNWRRRSGDTADDGTAGDAFAAHSESA